MRFKHFLEEIIPKVGDLIIKFDKDDNPYAGNVISTNGKNIKAKFKKRS